jgi:serine/threonine-protein kinase
VTPPPPPPQQTVDPATKVARYISAYEGGDCFFLNPITQTGTAANIEGFGSTPAPFETFIQDFRRALGFEPEVALRLVNDAQCPAVTFLRRVGIDQARSPKLQLGAFNLKAGDTFNATVEDSGSRHVSLLLIADDGYIYNLENYAKRDGRTTTFTLRPNRRSGQAGQTQPQPQLVMAVASLQPLGLIETDKPLPADALFPLLAGEAQSLGGAMGVTVKYFRLGN